MLDQGIITFEIYEDSINFAGIASVTLPDVSFLSQSITGAGMGGNVDAIYVGMLDAMTLGMEFRTITEHSLRMSEPRRHTIDLRTPQQAEDPISGTVIVQPVKHIFVVIPKKDGGGSIAPASPANGSGEYAVRYWATYLDGIKVRELDPLNCICFWNGKDYFADVRNALGK